MFSCARSSLTKAIFSLKNNVAHFTSCSNQNKCKWCLFKQTFKDSTQYWHTELVHVSRKQWWRSVHGIVGKAFPFQRHGTWGQISATSLPGNGWNHNGSVLSFTPPFKSMAAKVAETQLPMSHRADRKLLVGWQPGIKMLFKKTCIWCKVH